MLANWNKVNPVCIQLGSQSSYKESNIQLWWQDLKKVYTVYNNASCESTSVGTIYDTFLADWSAPVSGLVRQGAARVKLSSPQRLTEGVIPSPTIDLPTDSEFILFYAEDNQLYQYTVSSSADQDADGYPLGINPPSSTYRK